MPCVVVVPIEIIIQLAVSNLNQTKEIGNRRDEARAHVERRGVGVVQADGVEDLRLDFI